MAGPLFQRRVESPDGTRWVVGRRWLLDRPRWRGYRFGNEPEPERFEPARPRRTAPDEARADGADGATAKAVRAAHDGAGTPEPVLRRRRTGPRRDVYLDPFPRTVPARRPAGVGRARPTRPSVGSGGSAGSGSASRSGTGSARRAGSGSASRFASLASASRSRSSSGGRSAGSSGGKGRITSRSKGSSGGDGAGGPGAAIGGALAAAARFLVVALKYLAIAAAIIAAVLFVIFVALPALVLVVEALLLGLLVAGTFAWRAMTGRPWIVEARRIGTDVVRAWRVDGYRETRRVIDEVAEDLRAGEDPDPDTAETVTVIDEP